MNLRQKIVEPLRYRLLHPTSSQKRHLIALFVSTLTILLCYNSRTLTPLLYPFKLLTVAFHESGHALATWVTGGKVVAIELDPYEGGVTYTSGGWVCLILPAGYLGSSLVGALLVFTTFHSRAVTFVAIIIAVLMLVLLTVARSALAVIESLLAVLFIGGTFHPRLKGYGHMVRYVLITFVGVMSSLYSINDILDDLILREVDGSDAVVFSQKCFWLPTFLHGIIWCIVSIGTMIIGLAAGLLVFRDQAEETREQIVRPYAAVV